MVHPATDAVIQPLIDASKIDLNPAKTITYWRVATTRLADTRFFPGIALIGPSGSGKSTIERALKVMDEPSSYSFSCAGISAAAARDELAKAFNQVAIAEEFDQMSDQLAAARFFQARCDRETSAIAFKERSTDNGPFKAKTVEIFGATVLHARNALADPGLSSRMIAIHTRHRPGPYPEFNLCDDAFFRLVSAVDWSVQATGVLANGRLYDTWLPILRVAAGLEDQEYLDWASTQIHLLQQKLEEAAGYDHRLVILARIAEVIAEREEALATHPWDRINVEQEIGVPINRVSLTRIAPIEVGNAIRDLGFTTKRIGGRLWLYATPSSLLLSAQENGYEDEWVNDLKGQIDMKFGA